MIPLVPVRRAPWILDFASVGFVSGFVAPAVFFGGDMPPLYSALASVGGSVAGALLGWMSARLMAGGMRRWRRFWLLPLGVAVGALWGGVAGAVTALSPRFAHLGGLSVLVAAIAGALQLGWFWLAYCVRRVNQRSTWPVLSVALVTALGLGFAASGLAMLLVERIL